MSLIYLAIVASIKYVGYYILLFDEFSLILIFIIEDFYSKIVNRRFITRAKNKINDFTGNKIIITGWVNSVEKYIPAFDIAVLPSQWEGFGLALIEYMACDKPIIASNVGGIINIIKDKKNGLIFKAHEYEDLIEKMKILIENNIIVKNIVQENREYRKAYDIKLLIEKHEKLFKTL